MSKRLSKDIGPIFPVTKTQQLKAQLPCLRIEVSKPLTSLISSSRSCSCFSSKSPIIYIIYIWNLVFWKDDIMLCVLFVELPHIFYIWNLVIWKGDINMALKLTITDKRHIQKKRQKRENKISPENTLLMLIFLNFTGF